MSDAISRVIITAVDQTGAAFSSAERSISSLSAKTDQLSGLSRGAGTALGAIGVSFSVAGAIAATKQIADAIIGAEATAAKFKATFTSIGGAESVGREMEFVRATARQLGLDLDSTANSYAKLSAASRGTALEGQATREIFGAVSRAATTLGLSTSEADGALLAITQMMSKGTVQSEELRGQLGERLPGAFQIAARAMGVSTQELGKMLEAGQVMAEEFLPKFAKQLEKELGQASADAAGTASRELNRLKNDFSDLVKTVAEGGSAKAMGGFFGLVAQGLAGITEKMKLMREEAKADGGGFLSWLMGGGLTGQAFRALQGAAGTAQQRLDDANKTIASGQGGFYAQGQAAAERDRALADLQRLRSLTSQPGGAQEGDDSLQNAKLAAEAKAVDELRSKYTALSLSLSGQSKEYLANLTLLQSSREKGIISETEYIAQVKKLTLEQGGVKDSIAARTKAEKDAQEQAKKLNAEYFEALGVSKDYAEKVKQLETLQKTGRISVDEYARAIKTLADEQKVSKDNVDAERKATDLAKQAEKERMAVLADLSKRRNAESTALTKQLEDADKAIQATKDENEKIGLTGTALADLTAKRWDDKAAMVEQRIDQLAAVGGLGDEYSALVALTGKYRENAEEIRRGARLTAIADEAKKAKDEWQRQSDSIGQSLTDALLRGFESGKGFGQNLAASLKNMFNTLILKPIIQPIAQNAASSLMGLLGMGGAGAATAGTGVAGAAGQLASGGNVLATLFGGSNAGALFGSGAGIGGAATTFATSGLGQLLGLSETVGGVGVGLTGAGSSLVGGLSSIPGWGWALGGAVALAGILGKKRGGPKLGGSFSTTGERLFTPNGADSEASGLGQSALAGITDLAAQLGGSASGLSLGLGFDSDPQGTAGNRIASFLRDAGGRTILDNIGGRDVGRDDATLQASLGDETSRLILAGLKASDLPTAVRDFLATVDLSSVTAGSMDGIIAEAKRIAAQEASWQSLVSSADAAAANATGPRGSAIGGDLASFTEIPGYNPMLASSPDGVGPLAALSPVAQAVAAIGDAVQVLSNPAIGLSSLSATPVDSVAAMDLLQEEVTSNVRDLRNDQRTIGAAQAAANTMIIEQLNLMRSAFERINIIATMASVRPA